MLRGVKVINASKNHSWCINRKYTMSMTLEYIHMERFYTKYNKTQNAYHFNSNGVFCSFSVSYCVCTLSVQLIGLSRTTIKHHFMIYENNYSLPTVEFYKSHKVVDRYFEWNRYLPYNIPWASCFVHSTLI